MPTINVTDELELFLESLKEQTYKDFELIAVDQNKDDKAYKILEKYQDRFKNLKTIIVDISYFSLYATLETGPEQWRAKNYNIYYDIPTSKATNNFEILTNKLDINYSRMKSYYTKKIKNDILIA